MIAVAVLMLASVATAARTSMLVTFSSPGPDTYADNSAGADGECYALVWTDDAANFAMADDGTVTGGKVAATVPAAEGGRCPVVKIHFDAEAAAEYADGTWGLYLLDTRGSAAGERTVSGAKLVANATIEVAAERFLKHSTLRSGMFLAAAGNYNVATEADLRAALAEGGNITLDADIAIGLELVVSNSVTLNLGTHTITVTAGNAIQVAANGNLVVEGTTGGIKADSGYAIFADYELSPGVKTITVNGGVIDGAVQFNKYPLYDSAGTVQSGEAAVPTTIVVNGGTFKGHIGVYHCPFTVNGGTFEQGLDTSDGSVSIYANYKCPVTITGGQFKMEPVGAGNRIIVGDGYYHDGYFVVGDTSACQAVRNGKLYLTLAEALETVGPNTTVSLKEGASFSGDPINVVLAVGQSLTFPNSLLGTAILVSGVGGTEIAKSYGVGATTYFVKTTDAARIGGTPYTTLDDAFAVVQDGETITVLKDCTLNTASLSALGCAATLDLNAHAVAVSGETADLSSAQLTIQGMGVLSGFA